MSGFLLCDFSVSVHFCYCLSFRRSLTPSWFISPMTPPKPISCPPALLPEGDAYFTVKLQDYTAVEKDQVVLECVLNKEVDVIWYHNQAEVRPSKTVAIRAEGLRRALVLRKVSHGDAGPYTCDCGTDKTTATLQIEGKDAWRGRSSSSLKEPHLLMLFRK